jgi:nucleoside 2-deoxyribosyltransferase
MRIYVGCALAESAPEFVAFIAQLKQVLRDLGHEVLEFMGPVNGTPAEVFQHDIEQVLNAELVIAIADFPSTGLGFEICTALHANIPVFAFALAEQKVSRLTQGIVHPNYAFHWYETLEDLLTQFQYLCINKLEQHALL